jgi:hypothetical protein
MPATINEGFEDSQTQRKKAVKNPFEDRYDTLKAKKENKDKEFASGGAMFSLLRNTKGQFKNYVESAGRDTGFADTQAALDKAINDYDDNILFPLVSLRKEIINSTDINSKMSELTDINKKLAAKRKELSLAKDAYSTAQIRDKALVTRNKALSYQQTWGIMQRPIKKQTVPVLIVFSLLFIYLGVMGIYYISPVSTLVTTASAPSLGDSDMFGRIRDFFLHNPMAAALVQAGGVIGAILIVLKAFNKI